MASQGDAIRVDYKPSPVLDACLFIEDAEDFPDFTPGIREHGKGRPAIHHFGEFIVIPHFVNEYTVNAHGQNFNAQLLKFRIFFGNCRNLSCSNKGKITRIKAKQYPFPQIFR